MIIELPAADDLAEIVDHELLLDRGSRDCFIGFARRLVQPESWTVRVPRSKKVVTDKRALRAGHFEP